MSMLRLNAYKIRPCLAILFSLLISSNMETCEKEEDTSYLDQLCLANESAVCHLPSEPLLSEDEIRYLDELCLANELAATMADQPSLLDLLIEANLAELPDEPAEAEAEADALPMEDKSRRESS